MTDYEARITKLEAGMETVRESNANLLRALELLQSEHVALRNQIELGFEKQHDRLNEMRDRIDALRDRIDALRDGFGQQLAEQRIWSEKNFSEIRSSIERGFAESRAEARASTRWRIGTTIAVVLTLAGLAAKAFGAY